MVNNVAAAVGTNPAVRIGTSGHPVTACFDVADVSEPTRDAGVWKAPANSRTITDAAITSASNTLTSVTAAFTTADIGRAVWITGAGAAAAVLAVTIMKLNGGTSVTVNAAAGTTVSGGTATIADAYTMDGLHPHTYGSVQAATVINTALIT
jgi:hypothetical protein